MVVAEKTFPSGIAFDSIDIHGDLLLVALPQGTQRLHLRDVYYLTTLAEALSLVGIGLSIGDFTTFISLELYRQVRDGELSERDFLAKWGR